MSERGNFRGGRGGRGDRGGRGSDRGGRGGSSGASGEKRKENILDLTKYMEKEITVKFNGGREGMSDPNCPVMLFADLLPSHWHVERLRSVDEPGSRQCERNHTR